MRREGRREEREERGESKLLTDRLYSGKMRLNGMRKMRKMRIGGRGKKEASRWWIAMI